MKLLRSLLIICLFGLANTTAAQSLDIASNQFISTKASLQFQPAFPEPGDIVTVNLNNYSADSGSASVNWYLDGVLQPDLKNERSIQYTAGELGEIDVVSAVLTFPDGRKVTTEDARQVSYLDVILEANTYVPSFYKGRPLLTNGSQVRATAILSLGEIVSAAEYSYKWSVDNTVLQGGPIRGGRTITFTTPVRTVHRLSLEVFDLDGSLVGQKFIQLPITKPEIEFYEYNSLSGLRPLALDGKMPFTESSMTIEAVPYHLDNNVFLTNSVFEWKLNNQTVNNSDQLRITLDQTGDANNNLTKVNFRVSSLVNFLQNANKEIIIGSSPLPF